MLCSIITIDPFLYYCFAVSNVAVDLLYPTTASHFSIKNWKILPYIYCYVFPPLFFLKKKENRVKLGLIVRWRCAPGQGTLPTRAVSRRRSMRVPGRTYRENLCVRRVLCTGIEMAAISCMLPCRELK